METMDGLEDLVARHLLEEGAVGYWFHHEIMRAAVYDQLSPGRRRLLHRRAGKALERLEGNNAATLAWHFEKADELGRAALHALRAGQAAKELFAHVEARSHFDRALSHLEWESLDLQDEGSLTKNGRLQIEALDGRGWALRLVGDMEAYARDLQRVTRLAESLGDAQTLAYLRWREAYTHRWFCRYAPAQAAARAGVQRSLAAGDRLLEALCRREMGLAARATGAHAEARSALELALSIFDQLGEVVYGVHALGNLATLCWYEGDHEQALELSEQALARCDTAGLPFERRLPLGDMGAAASALGAFDAARHHLEESLSLARQIADRTQEILCLTHLGWLALRLERPVEALKHLQAGLSVAERIGSCAEQSWLHSGLAVAQRLAVEAANSKELAISGPSGDRAVEHARKALQLAQTSGAAYDLKLARRILERVQEPERLSAVPTV
jgi:tetratricopeptide (TPR) repeat protein